MKRDKVKQINWGEAIHSLNTRLRSWTVLKINQLFIEHLPYGGAGYEKYKDEHFEGGCLQ